MSNRTEYPYTISEDDISALIAGQKYDLSPASKFRFTTINTRYDLLRKDERDTLLLQVVKFLGTTAQTRTSEQNLDIFEKGWNEIFEKCRAEGISFSALRPQYVTQKSLKYFRWNGDYAVSENPYLVDELINLILLETFSVYLKKVDHIYEYGCGTGQYLYLISELFPAKQLVGMDWTRASQKILGLMAQDKRNIRGYHFDMFNPDYAVRLPPNSAVLTIAALEQLSCHFQPFLDYVISQKPALVIHHEPIEELFEDDNLLDYLGLQYHKKRGYLAGYLSKLQEYEKKGLIKINQINRIRLGNQYCEAISRIIWEPVR